MCSIQKLIQDYNVLSDLESQIIYLLFSSAGLEKVKLNKILAAMTMPGTVRRHKSGSPLELGREL